MNFGEVTELRARLASVLLTWAGEPADEKTIKHVGRDIARELTEKHKAVVPPPEVSPDCKDLYDAYGWTVRNFCQGMTFDNAELRKLAGVCAGNANRLKTNVSLTPWLHQTLDEWVILVVVDARRYFTPRKKIPGGMLRLHVATGTPATEEFDQYLTDQALRRLAVHAGIIGKRSYHRLHPREFTQMKFAGLLLAGKPLELNEYRERASLNDRNRRVARARRRIERVCPQSFTHECYACHLSFSECRLGTHRRSFVLRWCPNCRTEGYFDPKELTQKVCQRCEISRWRRR